MTDVTAFPATHGTLAWLRHYLWSPNRAFFGRMWDTLVCVWPRRTPRFIFQDGYRIGYDGAAHCPALTSRWHRCMRALPCTSHDVRTPIGAMMVYGEVLVANPAYEPHGPRWWCRWFNDAAISLTARAATR